MHANTWEQTKTSHILNEGKKTKGYKRMPCTIYDNNYENIYEMNDFLGKYKLQK